MQKTDRRNFLTISLGTLAAAFSASVLYPLFKFIWPPLEASRDESRVGIPLEEMPIGHSRVISLRNESVIVIREFNQVVALSAVCTHLGCIVRYGGDGVVQCPCHQAAFDLSGNVTQGPAIRPLPSYPVKVEGSQIVVGL